MEYVFFPHACVPELCAAIFVYLNNLFEFHRNDQHMVLHFLLLMFLVMSSFKCITDNHYHRDLLSKVLILFSLALAL